MSDEMSKDLDPASSRTEVAPLSFPESGKEVDDSRVLIAGRYELVALLGAGAMGTVYRANDRELDEVVALKVLKKELAGSGDMLERFRREVKLARRVTHRNVARTFDIGEHGGDRFLTMEFIEGEMLAMRLERFGRLDVHEAASFARDIAGGLAAAHAAGVVHRDLKPENVVVARDGRAVITDFGIARAFAEAEQARGAGMRGRPGATMAGAIVGTPQYMAPEQVEGRADLDARADLYALGVMLYELATGVTPWPGDNAFSIAAARLLKPPPNPLDIVPDLPETFVAIVHKLMARDREERFASAEETARALAVLATNAPSRAVVAVPRPPVRIAQKKLAVLPIANLGDHSDDLLADAVGSELATRMASIAGVVVAPLPEVKRHAGAEAREAGRALGVDAVVSGSIRRAGSTTRLALRLVTVEDGFQLWSKHQEAADGGILRVLDEMVASITQTLTSERASATLSRQSLVDPTAQALYLKVRTELNHGWWGFTEEAVDSIRKAHALAPNEPRIAGTLALMIVRGIVNEHFSKDKLSEARRAIQIAFETDSEQAEARVARGCLNLSNNEGGAAISELQRALAFAPNSIDALDGLGRILSEVGLIDQAESYFLRALEIQPEFLAVKHVMARTRVLLGDFEASEVLMGPPPEQLTARFIWVLQKARFLAWNRDPDAVEKLRALMGDLSSKLPAENMFVKMFHALIAPADDRLRPTIEAVMPTKGAITPRRASFHAQIQAEALMQGGRVEEALEALRVADTHGLFDIFWLQRCRLFDPMRGTADFEAIRERTEMRAQRVIDGMENV